MKKYLFLLLILIFAKRFAYAQAAVSFVNPAGLAAPKGYSHLAVVDLGKSKMLILSGQVGLNEKGKLVGKDDVGAQTEQAFKNIKLIIEAEGGSMDDVVKLSYYLKDVSKIQLVRQARDKFINTKTPPASTLVEVSKLFRDDVLIEIEATAVIAKK